MTAAPDVIVIGAGFAGLSAAAFLADAGARVLVLEARPQAGGRATAFVDRSSGELVDNGQHVLFGCYRETLAFLALIGAADHVRIQPALELVCYDEQARRSVLRCPPLPAPLHLLGGILRWAPVPWTERVRALRVVLPVIRARRQLLSSRTVSAARGGRTVQDWLSEHGQGPVLQEWLWRPLTVAALNQEPRHAAAEPFLRVMAEMFAAEPRAASVVLPTRPLHEMYAEPARKYLESRGGQVRTSALARVQVAGGAVQSVEVRGERFVTRDVIAAVPWFALRNLFGAAPPGEVGDLLETADRMEPMPILTVNLWYDRPVMDEAFAGLPGRTMQWVFDKRLAWGGSASHLSLVSSGAAEIVRLGNEELISLAAREVASSLPRARGLRPLRATVVREKQATFSLAPGGPQRPGPRTGLRNLVLAGDWTDTGLPATIEGAVVSGRRAAAAVGASRPSASPVKRGNELPV